MGNIDFRQAVDYAIKREKEASALYTRMAGISSNPEANSFFLEMASEEQQHERTLIDLWSLSEAKEIAFSSPPDREVVERFRPLGALHEMAYEEAMLFAIQHEMDTAEYYMHISNIVTDETIASLFKSLSSWELVHKAKVEAEYERYFSRKKTANV